MVQSQSEPTLIGVWQLVSYEARDSKGIVEYPLAEQVIGELFYDPGGNMSVDAQRPPSVRFRRFRSGYGRRSPCRIRGLCGLFGLYTIDATKQIVTHHVRGASYPNGVATEQIRYYKFDGKHLTLSTRWSGAASRWNTV
jgi:lipocalin-like protein